MKFYKDYYLIKGEYNTGNRMFLCLQNENECYSDITINLPNLYLNDNEIAITNDLPEEDVNNLIKMGLFKIVGQAQYNYGIYHIAKINKELIDKYAIDMKDLL